MYCIKCGAYNEDNSKFCSGCGAPLNRQEGQTMYSQPEPKVNVAGKRSAGTPLGGLWRHYASPLFIIGTILLSISFFFMADGVAQFKDLFSMVFGIGGIGGLVFAIITPIVIIAIVAELLLVAAFWMLSVSGLKKGSLKLESVAYVFLKIDIIFYIVVLFIGLAACVVVFVGAMSMQSYVVGSASEVYSVYSGGILAFGWIAVVIVLAVIILAIVTLFKAYSCCSSFAKAAKGEGEPRLSVFVAVMLIIYGILGLLATISVGGAASILVGVPAGVLLNLAVSSVAPIIFAIWIIVTKDKL